MEENDMKKLKFYTFIMPGSMPGLVKDVKEKKLPGLTYIGSVTIPKDGELVYEGIVEEFKDWIKTQIERLLPTTLFLRAGKKEFIEDEGHFNVLMDLFVKPGHPYWWETLEEAINNRLDVRVPGGKELHAELEYLDEEQKKEAKEARRKLYKEACPDEHLTWPEFIKKHPRIWEAYKKYRKGLVERVKKKYPDIDTEPKEAISG